MKNEILNVGREYRTNSLSFVNGGHYVEVQFSSGHNFGYDNIHNWSAYVSVICKNNIEYGKVIGVKVDGNIVNF